MNQNRIAAKLWLTLILSLGLILLSIAWVTTIYQSDNLILSLLRVVGIGQTVLLCAVVVVWLVAGARIGLGLRLLEQFQGRRVYVFLLMEFAVATGTIVATGYSYQKPSSAVLMSFLAVLCLVQWLVFRDGSVPPIESVFATSWGLMVLFTPDAISGFTYALTHSTSSAVTAIASAGHLITLIVFALLLLFPFVLQIESIRLYLKRLRDSYLNRPKSLYRFLFYAAVYLVIAGCLPLPYNHIGLWVAMLLLAPLTGLMVLRCLRNTSTNEPLQWNINTNKFRIGLALIAILFLILAIFSAGKQMWIWFPDTFSYLHIAQEYARGNFLVRGYWSPLMPWLLALPIGNGIDPTVSQRFLNIGCGLLIIAASVILARRYRLARPLQLAVAFTMSLVLLQYSFSPATPDVLAAVPTTLFFVLLLSEWFWQSPVRGGLVAGLLIAIGYYGKHYNFPFMVASLLGTVLLVGTTRTLYRKGPRLRNLAVMLVCSFGLLAVLMLPWVAAMYNRYNIITYSTVSIIARNTPTSGQGIAHGCVDWFICDNPKDVLFPWEDPLIQYYPGRLWSPFASVDNFQQEIRILTNSVLVVFDQFPLGPLVLLALFATAIGIFRFWDTPRMRFLCSWTVMIILVQLGGYISTGYTNLYNLVEYRYHLTLMPLIVVMLFWVFQSGITWLIRHGERLISATNAYSGKPLFLTLCIAGISLSTVILPQIAGGLASPQDMANWVRTGLPSVPCDRAAAEAVNDVLIAPFASTDLLNLSISFYTGKRTFGVVRWPKELVSDSLREEYNSIGIDIPSTAEEVDTALHKMGVKTFIVTDAPELTAQLTGQFHYQSVRELTICQKVSTVLYVPEK